MDADRPPLRPGARKAALRRGARRARAGRRGRRRHGRGRGQRRLHARRSLAPGPCGGRRRGRGAERAGRPLPDRRRLAETRRSGPALDRLPERRHAEGRHARRPRGLRLRRAPEALHDARHGDRPGQDLQRQRPRRDGRPDRAHDRGDGDHDLPPALRPGPDERRRRAEARRADQPAEAPAARARAPRRRRADARIRRLAEARLVRRRTIRSGRSSARPRAPAIRSRCSTAPRSARSRSSAPTRRSSPTSTATTASPP